VITTHADASLDALKELANIGSGNAATALSSLLGRPVEVGLPSAASVSLLDLTTPLRPAAQPAIGVSVAVTGDLDAVVLLAFPPDDAAAICDLLGAPTGSELAPSALGEVGNVMACSYIGAIGTLARLELEPRPPQLVGGTLSELVFAAVSDLDRPGAVVLLDSRIEIDAARCSFDFVFVPDACAVESLLARLGAA
jgi:chemotaxis protein CheC